MDKYLQDYLLSKYRHIFDEGVCIDCNNGWFWLIDNTLNSIYNYQKNNKIEFIKINTIKQKFGLLNIYYNKSNDVIFGITVMAKYLSSDICEFCSSTDNVGKTKNWVFTVCKNCYDNEINYNFERIEWELNNDNRLLKLNKIKGLIK